jgi:hypothetical protein
MLARLNRASRRGIALIWAMAAVFASAPGVSMAFATPVGAFSRFLLHVHDDGASGHVHHGHGDHRHNHGHDGDGVHHHHDGLGHASDADTGQPWLHVHHDACCPSLLLPAPCGASVQHRLSDRIAVLRVEPLQGAPPGRLFRPPIPV